MPEPAWSAVYDSNNQLTQWGLNAMTYDLNGTTLSDGMNSYTWDARNRLASANNSGASVACDPLEPVINFARMTGPDWRA